MADNKDKVAQLVELSGGETTHEFARSMLESNGWDVQAAADVLFGGGGGDSPEADPAGIAAAAYANGAHQSSSSSVSVPYDDGGAGVRAPDAARVDTLLQGAQSIQMRGVHEPFRDYSEEWTRQRRAKNLAKLYEPPREMIFRGTLDQLCQTAAHRGMWVLINIQAVKEFRSHVLNRDVWRDDRIKEMIRRHFVFWQKDADSQSGQMFNGLYRINGRYPYICVIDPRTREELASFTGEEDQEADNLLKHLNDFIDKHGTLGEGNAQPPEEKAISELTEEELMQMAIEESLKKEKDPAADNEEATSSSVATAAASSSSSSSSSSRSGPSASSSSSAVGRLPSPTSAVASSSSSMKSGTSEGEPYRSPFLDIPVKPMLKIPAKPAPKVEPTPMDTSASSSSSSSSNGNLPTNDRKRKLDDESATSDAKPPPAKREKPAVPLEPESGADGATTLKIRVMPGMAVTRRFLKTNTVQNVVDFVSLQPLVARRVDTGDKFFLCTMFPKKELVDCQKTLEAYGVLNTQIVIEWES